MSNIKKKGGFFTGKKKKKMCGVNDQIIKEKRGGKASVIIWRCVHSHLTLYFFQVFVDVCVCSHHEMSACFSTSLFQPFFLLVSWTCYP